MADNKKKLNITVKKTTSPFLFPDSNSNKEKDTVVYVQTQSTVVSTVTTVSPTSAAPSTGSNSVPVAAEPEKRKRGRPRLNKDALTAKELAKPSKIAPQVQQVAQVVNIARNNDMQEISTSSQIANTNAMETFNTANANNDHTTNASTSKNIGIVEIEAEKILKKRGRKPKSQNISINVSDRVYGLNNSKNSMDLENLENLSYIVNLKITKEKVEEIIEEINEEIEQSKKIVFPVLESPTISDQNVMSAVSSVTSTSLPSIGKAVSTADTTATTSKPSIPSTFATASIPATSALTSIMTPAIVP